MVSLLFIPVAAEQAQIISSPPACLIVCMRCLCWLAVFGFHQTCRCASWPSWLNMMVMIHRTSAKRTFFQKSCGLFRCNFGNLSCAALLLLEKRGFLLQPFLTNFNMLAEACRVWDVALGFLVWHWRELAGSSITGKIDNSQMFSTCKKSFQLWNDIHLFVWKWPYCQMGKKLKREKAPKCR